MRRVFSILPAFVLALAGTALGDNGRPAPKLDPLQQTRRALEADPNIKFDPGSVLVRFKADVPEATRDAIRAVVGGDTIKKYTLVPDLEHLSVLGDSQAASGTLRLFQAAVLYAEPDSIVHNCVNNPNDTYYSLLWGMNNTGQTVNGDPGTNNADINAPEAWDITTGSQSFIIADIDTGANYNHPDLAANIWTNPGEIAGNGVDDDHDGFIDDIHGYDFYNNDGDPIDDNGHGTHTAGTIGAVGNNGVGVTGVNWHCSIMPLKFLGSGGSGSTSGAISALNFAVAHGAKVSNNSWGSTGFSQALSDAITSARAAGHIVVCAAGNNGSNNDSSPFYPASYTQDNVIAVAATDNDDHRASFSNYGATSVDLGAPGVTILSTYQSGYAYLDGTSMATPHVTGVVALVWGLHPTWTYTQVRTQIFTTVRPLTALQGITVTGGIVNAFAAVGGGGGGNTAPTVTISSPSNGQSFNAGTSVTFTGSASDAQDGNLSASLVWTSNLQGQIGTGASFSRSDLVVGTHTITASVTDSGGLVGSAPVTITIQSTNTAPTVTISSPSNGQSFNQGTSVTFSGSASDAQDGDLSASLVWTSNLQGQIGTGASFSRSDLVVGTHTITASVTDSGGLVGSAPVTITIQSTAPQPPAAPSNLTAVRGPSSGTALLSWSDNSSNETGFEIQREQKIQGGWVNLTTIPVGANSTSFIDNPGTGNFHWRIRAVNAAGQSAYTPWFQLNVR